MRDADADTDAAMRIGAEVEAETETALDPALEALTRAMETQEREAKRQGGYEAPAGIQSGTTDARSGHSQGIRAEAVGAVATAGDDTSLGASGAAHGNTTQACGHRELLDQAPYTPLPLNAEASSSALTLVHPPSSALSAPASPQSPAAPALEDPSRHGIRGRGRPKGSKNKPKDKDDPAYRPTKAELRERANYDEHGQRIWKKRGRPPKGKPAELAESVQPTATAPSVAIAPKQRRPKPSKRSIDPSLEPAPPSDPPQPPAVPKKRGRPRKDPNILVRDIRPRPRRKSELARRKGVQTTERLKRGAEPPDSAPEGRPTGSHDREASSSSGSIQAPERRTDHLDGGEAQDHDSVATLQQALMRGSQAYLEPSHTGQVDAENVSHGHVHTVGGHDGQMPALAMDPRAWEELFMSAASLRSQ